MSIYNKRICYVIVIVFTMSIGIDREFERLLEEIFGAEFISLFKARRPAGWVDLMIAFESRKRAADPNKDQPLNVSLPFSLIDFHKKHFVSRSLITVHSSSSSSRKLIIQRFSV